MVDENTAFLKREKIFISCKSPRKNNSSLKDVEMKLISKKKIRSNLVIVFSWTLFIFSIASVFALEPNIKPVKWSNKRIKGDDIKNIMIAMAGEIRRNNNVFFLRNFFKINFFK
ncbi:MAG: hypothetical protein ACTSYF_07630 [Promethearchaeota archaeon]